ncbi:unnamed protein product [Eruca vesicaria subsp. sativa]|uniref:CTLH domain-containing protein n=1 Tax=Eruca vesicaria subsp. sativa TaxID=29727 RepID=A0ABC8JEG3_ERUVS|nr:unnamed protein product [Eruca vesicaria subsp. sativa]
MSSLSRELVFLILQFLEEEKFKESVNRLEKESGFFFNTKYFDEKVLGGEWDEIEKYLSGFTKLDDNIYSMKIFSEIRKQKYLDALDKQDKAKAVEILVQDLRVFSTFNEELYKEITQLLTLHNFSLNWQHQLCKNPRPNPDIKTLFTDHTCAVPNGPLAPSPVSQPVITLTKPTDLPSLGAHGPFSSGAAVAAANAGALASWMAAASGASTVQAVVFTPASIPLPQNQVSILKRPRTPPANPGVVDYQNPDHELMNRLRPTHLQHAPLSLEDLPLKAALACHQGSIVTSMEFHPMQNTLLLVGSSTGEITLWELASREKLVTRRFKIWDMDNCTHPDVNFIGKFCFMHCGILTGLWSQSLFNVGVAYKKHLIHLYAFSGPNNLRQHAEKLSNLIDVEHVWDVSGRKHSTFEGHDAPVYSICHHHKENIQFIFSTAIDGKIKAWLYDNMGFRVDYDAPGKWCTTMLYSADGTRLFSCGTSKDGYFFLVEWNKSEGSIKRTYHGFQKKLAGNVQFDTSKNHFLAVCEDGQIKFWDMDNINVLTSTDAEGGLPALPRLRFNREGNLLAVTTADNGFKILANQAISESLGIDPPKARIDDHSTDKPKPWQLAEILDPAWLPSVARPLYPIPLVLPQRFVVRLLYTNSGAGILALCFNGIQRLWKWVRNEQNPSGKATAAAVLQHWQPNSGLLMTNYVSGVNLEEANPCIALSKNDSYVMSAAGGKVSLFSMMTFKLMTTFMSPPPASIFLAFHPQDNNIIAIGMEDSTIDIYNVRVDEVKSKLKGHQKRITGLAFSTTLNILVSSGADAQMCNAAIDTWEKRKSVAIQMPAGKAANGDTRVQFPVDQIRILAVHETQLAIFDASRMECIRQLMYTTSQDGNIGVFDADTLRLRCRISPSACLKAHPQEPNQFAVGLNDGSVKVIEPAEAEGKWGMAPPPSEAINTSPSTTRL